MQPTPTFIVEIRLACLLISQMTNNVVISFFSLLLYRSTGRNLAQRDQASIT